MSDRPSLHTLVVIPTYNELENLPIIIGRLQQARPDVHILVVDDGSPDGTGQLADELALADPDRVHVMHRTSKAGLGAAYLAGFAWGLGRGYSVLVEMDADGSHQPELLPSLLAALHDLDADMVKGSRWMRGGATDQTRSRELLSRLANIYIQVAMDIPVRDATGGYNAFRSSILRKVDLTGVASKGYTFQVDMTRRVLAAGGKVVEVPIYFPDREIGDSKMSGSIIGEALLRTTEWGAQKRWSQLKGVGEKNSDEFAKMNSQASDQ